MKVLVVEDNEVVRLMLTNLLTVNGLSHADWSMPETMAEVGVALEAPDLQAAFIDAELDGFPDYKIITGYFLACCLRQSRPDVTIFNIEADDGYLTNDKSDILLHKGRPRFQEKFVKFVREHSR